MVNVPGLQGDPGVDGVDGLNSYTTTTDPFDVPAENANVTIDVENSDWMAIGQIVVVDGPAHFSVVSKPSSITAELKFENFTGDVAATTTIDGGSTVVGTGTEATVALDSETVTASGTAYTLTASYALLDFGTDDPTITIASAIGEKWLLTGSVTYNYDAWKSTVEDISTVIRRTNNTAANVAETETVFTIVDDTSATAVSGTAAVISLPTVVYTAAGTNDILQVWGTLSGLASVSGNIKAVAATITAVKIA